MSKCVKCGNEILTGDIHWEMGLCNNCYNELYKDHKTHISLDKMWLKLAQDFRDENEKLQEKITDLEAKLAESEKKFIVANNLRKHSDEVLLNYKTKKYGLDKTIQELRKMKLNLPEKEWYYKGFENCERQMSSHIADLTLEVKELKQQLAEKEKSLSIKSVVRTLMKDNNLNCTFRDKTNAQIQQCGDVYNSNYGYFNFEDDYDESLNNKTDNRFDITSIDLTNQDKISFALEQLENVKEHFINIKTPTHGVIRMYEMVMYIDNQIKQLKEGK